jgi:hypothetical protein
VIHLMTEPATSKQLQEMLQECDGVVKIVVDIRRRILAGGGEVDADCESALLEEGSEQDDLWGANWYPAEQRIASEASEALINIRPLLGNRGILIQDEDIRHQVEKITRAYLGG